MRKIVIDENIKGLIFDCDGTLVDSMTLHMQAWEKAFNHFNVDYKHDYLVSLRGMKETAIIELYNKEFGTRLDGAEMVRVKHGFFIKNIHQVKPLKVVTDIVENYFGILPLAVVSGSTRTVVHKELEIIGILDKFETILTADDPFKAKPAPDKFIEAARRIGVPVKDCMVFEDGDPGIVAAKAAGMHYINVLPFL